MHWLQMLASFEITAQAELNVSTLLCGLNIFPLVWATVSAVLCKGVSCLMNIIWLDFPRDKTQVQRHMS